MKTEYVFPIFVGFALACSFASRAADRADDKKPKPVTVAIKSLSFDPKKLEIRVGDSVVWTNESKTAHTSTSDDDGKTFDTGEVEPSKSSKPVKFEKEGEFKYHCKVHGKTMSGTIVVKPAGQK
jgi:plastocyanin